jgi:hypothetical protein
VDVGQTVAASFQTRLFHYAQDMTKMQIDTSVDEADIGKMGLVSLPFYRGRLSGNAPANR